MILFFVSLFKLLLNNSFHWLKAFLAIPILVLISFSHLPSLVVRAPRRRISDFIFTALDGQSSPSPSHLSTKRDRSEYSLLLSWEQVEQKSQTIFQPCMAAFETQSVEWLRNVNVGLHAVSTTTVGLFIANSTMFTFRWIYIDVRSDVWDGFVVNKKPQKRI